ncbi:GNAT family N-acetyltransferase [Clostridium sp. FP2]|uniref:GNAT family N-acetyltransferase n=1 Tax=Clostridium sp. FP2 TaxID=2724481 RepID=UPI0013E9864F|nr:GNAT family N-acetyltransferase [Clostridium sp. FP2]MBZ9623802.1 GNAT family N-acetyltransferase [Clostridium sp. FP2]
MRGYSIIDGMNMRVYELVKVQHPQYSQGDFRIAKEEDLKIVSTWIYSIEKDEGSDITYEKAYDMAKNKINDGQLYLWEDKVAVSMACISRPTINGIVVNMVYTPPELRGRGYASSCVASLSQYLLNIGYKFCSLFTDLSNPTSNSIYIKIGYKPICDYKSYSFK